MLHLVERQPQPVRLGHVGYTSPLMPVVLRQHKMVLTSCTADNATDNPMKLRSQRLGHFFISLSRRIERSDRISERVVSRRRALRDRLYDALRLPHDPGRPDSRTSTPPTFAATAVMTWQEIGRAHV